MSMQPAGDGEFDKSRRQCLTNTKLIQKCIQEIKAHISHISGGTVPVDIDQCLNLVTLLVQDSMTKTWTICNLVENEDAWMARDEAWEEKEGTVQARACEIYCHMRSQSIDISSEEETTDDNAVLTDNNDTVSHVNNEEDLYDEESAVETVIETVLLAQEESTTMLQHDEAIEREIVEEMRKHIEAETHAKIKEKAAAKRRARMQAKKEKLRLAEEGRLLFTVLNMFMLLWPS
jgi:hypothetical protein